MLGFGVCFQKVLSLNTQGLRSQTPECMTSNWNKDSALAMSEWLCQVGSHNNLTALGPCPHIRTGLSHRKGICNWDFNRWRGSQRLHEVEMTWTPCRKLSGFFFFYVGLFVCFLLTLCELHIKHHNLIHTPVPLYPPFTLANSPQKKKNVPWKLLCAPTVHPFVHTSCLQWVTDLVEVFC